MMHPTSAWIDGRLVPAGAPHRSVTDRGFQLGDAVFETLRARAGRSIELDRHVTRLRHSLEVLEINAGPDLEARLAAGIRQLLDAEGLGGPDGDAAVRITISRGAAPGRGTLPPAGTHPTVVIQAWPMQPPPAAQLTEGLNVVISSVRRDPENPMSAVKSTSRADSVYARLEATRADADDAIFLTTDGYLSEGTAANLFLLVDGRLITPSLACGILEGTTRAWLLGWGERAGLRPDEGLFTTRHLAEADEAFMCSSVAGVIPVTRFEGRSIGAGRPGPWTRRARADREACFDGQPAPASDASGAPGSDPGAATA